MSRLSPTLAVAVVWSGVMITGGSIWVLDAGEAAADAAAVAAAEEAAAGSLEADEEDDEQPASTATPRRAAALTAAAVRVRDMEGTPSGRRNG